MRRLTFCLLTITLVALAAVPAMAANQSDSYVLGDGPSLAERSASIAERHEMLQSREMEAGLSNPITVRVGKREMAAMEAGQSMERRVRVGVVKPVGVEISFLDVMQLDREPVLREVGALRGTDTGFEWTGRATSRGASAMRVHFTDFYMPTNAALYLYTTGGQVAGPYTHRGPKETGSFWSQTLFGDDVRMQIVYEGGDRGRAIRVAHFTVDDVAHIGSKFRVALGYQASTGDPSLVTRATCDPGDGLVENASCVNNGTSGAPGVTAAAQAGVAHIQYVSGRYTYICSGGLVADTAQTGAPYFLTANHCISKGREANSMETYFNFTSGCDYPQVGPNSSGASILSTSRTSDYTLMQLNGPVTGGPTAIGYDASVDMANANGATLYRISHPSGAPQTFSSHVVNTSRGTCSSWPRGDWIYSVDNVGATEGGSSGSPVLNDSGKVVGQLSGACGTNVNDTCDSTNNATVDGNLNAFFGNVAQWLDPDGGPTCDTGPEICDDGCDNDGDGLIDSADPDCDGGGTCELGQPGDSCTSNSECCSNKCRGPSGRKTCR